MTHIAFKYQLLFGFLKLFTRPDFFVVDFPKRHSTAKIHEAENGCCAYNYDNNA